MNQFYFDPNLFARRAEAHEALEHAGFVWLQNFSAIDLAHDVGGLEVCGISTLEEARRILTILKPIFPNWKYCYTSLKDFSPLDMGWQAKIQERPEPVITQ